MKVYKHIGFLLLLLITLACVKQEQNVVARLNDEAITRAELKHWMLLEKASVYNYFFRKYKVEDSEHFWTEKQGDEIPLELLKAQALEKVKRCKIQQLLALEKGIIKTSNFDEIMKELETVNAERKKKVEKGEPIYGPKQFTSRTYFFHVFDKMVIALKNELAKNELKPSNEQLKLMQSANNHSDKDISGFLTMQYVDTNYEAFIDNLMNATVVKINKKIYSNISLE